VTALSPCAVPSHKQSKKQIEAKKQQKEWLQHTLTPSFSPVFLTPKTIKNIESFANHLTKEFNYSLFPNTFKHNIKAFLKDSNAKALTDQLTENDLTAIKNKNNSKTAKKKNDKRII